MFVYNREFISHAKLFSIKITSPATVTASKDSVQEYGDGNNILYMVNMWKQNFIGRSSLPPLKFAVKRKRNWLHLLKLIKD